MCHGFFNYVDTVSCSSEVVQTIHTSWQMIVLQVCLCCMLGKATQHTTPTQAARGALAMVGQGTLRCAFIPFYNPPITFSATQIVHFMFRKGRPAEKLRYSFKCNNQ